MITFTVHNPISYSSWKKHFLIKYVHADLFSIIMLFIKETIWQYHTFLVFLFVFFSFFQNTQNIVLQSVNFLSSGCYKFTNGLISLNSCNVFKIGGNWPFWPSVCDMVKGWLWSNELKPCFFFSISHVLCKPIKYTWLCAY